MKRVCLLLIAFIMLSNVSMAQMVFDTIYYNKSWKETTSENHAYYRITTPDRTGYQVKDYYKGGILQMEGHYTSYNPEIKEGIFKYYNKKGDLSSESNYRSDTLEGLYKRYDSIGRVSYQANYLKGELSGEVLYFYENSSLKRKEYYTDGKLDTGYCYTREGKDTVYFGYEEHMPEFPGGQEALMRFIQDHLVYPKDARRRNIQGRVIVQFIVDKEGNVIEPEIINSVYPSIDQTVINMVGQMPHWKPGVMDGERVFVKYTLPVSFKLN